MNKKWRNLKKYIVYIGVWAYPLAFAALLVVARCLLKLEMTGNLLKGAAMLSLLPVLAIWDRNMRAKENGKQEFSVYAPFTAKTNPEYMPSRRRKATYPAVAKELLFDAPEGIVFGKWNHKFVCKPLAEDGHVFIIGGSGSGKSSCLVIPSLLSNPQVGGLVVDIKGELSLHCTKRADERVVVCDPSDRRQYGYDPFFALSEGSGKQEVLETMQGIAYSLVPCPADIKEPFWKLSARNLLVGLLIYYFQEGYGNFIDLIDCIMTQPMRTCVQEAVGNAPQTSDAYKYLVTFSDMADETFGGIETEVRNHLALFATDEDIRYFLKDNALRCSPERINDGCMVYLRLQEEKLTAYNDLLQVILNQTFAVLEKRSEYAEPCVVFIDELPRLVSSGKLERLLDGMRTLRSRKVTLCLVTQSLEALEGAYTPAQIADMQSNCSYRAILSANSAKTQREITAACGKYQEVKQTTSGEGRGEKITRTYEERDIVQPVDLVRLPTSGELVLLSTYGYCRLKKTPYYEEPIFSGTAARNVESHRARKREDA